MVCSQKKYWVIIITQKVYNAPTTSTLAAATLRVRGESHLECVSPVLSPYLAKDKE